MSIKSTQYWRSAEFDNDSRTAEQSPAMARLRELSRSCKEDERIPATVCIRIDTALHDLEGELRLVIAQRDLHARTVAESTPYWEQRDAEIEAIRGREITLRAALLRIVDAYRPSYAMDRTLRAAIEAAKPLVKR